LSEFTLFSMVIFYFHPLIDLNYDTIRLDNYTKVGKSLIYNDRFKLLAKKINEIINLIN